MIVLNKAAESGNSALVHLCKMMATEALTDRYQASVTHLVLCLCFLNDSMHMWGTEPLSLISDFWQSLKCEWELRCFSEWELRIPKSTDNVTDDFLEISIAFKILSNVILFTIQCIYIYSAYGDLSQATLHFYVTNFPCFLT